MEQLEHYRDLRLDLADSLRSSLYLARGRHDELIERSVRTLLKRLALDQFTVAIIGQHSRGKTTLMNALLGAEYLPTGILPMTSVVTEVKYGSGPRAEYVRRGSELWLPVALSEVPELVARLSARRAQLDIARVVVEVPADLLRLGLTFVDTPGVGSSDESGSAATLAFLPEIDAAVFVTAVDSAMDAADMQLLSLVPPSAPVFCVVNKIDLVNIDDVASVLTYVDETLSASLGRQDVEVFGLSALRGLHHRVAPGFGEGDGGVERFQSSLESSLSETRSRVAMATTLDLADTVFGDQRRMFSLAEHFAHLSEPDRADLRARTAAAFERAAQDRARIIRRMHDDAQAALDSTTESSRDRWLSELECSTDDAPESTPQAHRTTASTGWWAARNAQLSEVATSAVLRSVGELGATLDASREVALECAGLAPAPAAAVAAWSLELPAFAPLGFPTAEERSESEVDRHSSTQRRRRRSIRRIRYEAEQALDQLSQDLRRQNQQRTGWITDTTTRVAKDAEARLGQYLAGGPSEVELEAVSRIRMHLDAVRTGLTAQHAVSRAAVPARNKASATMRTPTSRSAFAGCVVCARQVSALIDDLSGRQLAIATRERDQRDFAEAGGLCAQHTWTYASLASPLGIASTYAPLSSRAANALVRASSAQALSATVRGFTGEDGACAACETLSRAEGDALGELEAGRIDGMVCMRHLQAAAEAGIRRPILQELAARLSDALRRHAEDMRAYALKREALARGSLTPEENAAYKETLLLLAGDPLLAGPGTSTTTGGEEWAG